MATFWNKEQEKKFFKESLDITNPESLFYLTKDGKFYAYWPKNYQGKKTTLQSRNSFIGAFTEKWSSGLFRDVAKAVGAFSIQRVICEEIGLTKKSPADVAICKTKMYER